jgi:hypothetical protein
MPTAAKPSINKSKIETVPHWISANSKTPKAPFSCDAAAERLSDKNPAMISRRVNGLPQKGREFDYRGKLPGFTKTVKVLPLSFTASVAMVPPSRFDDF